MKKTVKQVDVKVAMELVSRLYESAIDPAEWPGFLDGFAEAVQGGGTSIWVQDYSDGKAQLDQASGSFAAHARWAPGYLETYGAYYSAKNVWAQNAFKFPVGSALTSEMLYPDQEMQKTEYYSDWLRPQGLRYALGGPLHREGTLDVHFSCLRAEELGPFDSSHQELHGLLMPHFKRALGLHLRLSRERARAVSIMAAFDSMQSPVWVLDHRGIVSFANAAGMAIDAAHDGVWIDRSGRPFAADSADNQALRRLIANSIRLAQGGELDFVAPIAIRRQKSPLPLYINAYPVRNGPSIVAIALFVADPARMPQSGTETIRALFGLTEAEARLAVAIGQGASVSEYRDADGVSMNTVKTHLKRVLNKTGARNQAALVRLLASMTWNTPRSR
jgi:DNA-binding CsgD family transcriptional regulator/PAS domain-containing protein